MNGWLIIFYLSFLLALPNPLYSQIFGSFSPLLIEVGAAARGVGGAAVSRHDPASVYYNPASITGTKSIKGSIFGSPFTFSPRREVVYHTIAYRIGNRWVIGASFFNFQIEFTNSVDGEVIWKRTDSWKTFNITLAKQVRPRISLGATFKYFRTNFAERSLDILELGGSSNTYSFDLGILGNSFFPWSTLISKSGKSDFFVIGVKNIRKQSRGLSFGVSLLNVGPRYKFNPAFNDKVAQPLNLRVGGLWQAIETNLIGLNVTLAGEKELINLNKEYDPWYKALINGWGNNKPEFRRENGVEITFLNFLFLRLGITKRFFFSNGNKIYYNINSYGIGFGGTGYTFNYSVTTNVFEHSILDAIKDPGKFTDYRYDSSDKQRGFSFSIDL